MSDPSHSRNLSSTKSSSGICPLQSITNQTQNKKRKKGQSNNDLLVHPPARIPLLEQNTSRQTKKKKPYLFVAESRGNGEAEKRKRSDVEGGGGCRIRETRSGSKGIPSGRDPQVDFHNKLTGLGFKSGSA